jgi:hypothetical protein
LRRQGRFDAHRGFLRRHARRERRRRRRYSDRGRRGAGDQAARADAIATCFFGDGAVNRGPFLEGLNWAALYELPVLFVCEDNGVAAFTEADTVTAGAGIPARAEALGVPATSSTGMMSSLSMMPRRDWSPRCVAAKVRAFCTQTPSAGRATHRPTPPPGAILAVEAGKARDPIARLKHAAGRKRCGWCDA